MEVGELRYRIIFQEYGTITTPNGFDVEDWKDYKTVWSAVYPVKGKEFWSAKSVYVENTVKFICRYNPQINNKMRIKHGQRYFNIIGIIDVDERHKWLQIMAVEVV